MSPPGDQWTEEHEATLRKLRAAVEVSFAAGDYAVVMNMARMENVEQVPKSIWRRLASRPPTFSGAFGLPTRLTQLVSSMSQGSPLSRHPPSPPTGAAVLVKRACACSARRVGFHRR